MAKILIVEDDLKVNQKRFEIEEKCIQLVATQQPMASDLRIIISALKFLLSFSDRLTGFIFVACESRYTLWKARR